MHDWSEAEKLFFAKVDDLISRLPIGVNYNLLSDFSGVSFKVQSSPQFDCKIYLTCDMVGTTVDQDRCDLTCDFDSGVEFTISMTFNYFESLLTTKTRLKRWLFKSLPVAWCVEQWDGQNWVNTQGEAPLNADWSEYQILQNNLIFPCTFKGIESTFNDLVVLELEEDSKQS